MDFLFPEPVEVDMDGAVVDKPSDIPETVSDSASYLEELDILGDIPPMFRAEPAVLEAGRIIRGCSRSRGIPSWFRTLTDGRVVR